MRTIKVRGWAIASKTMFYPDTEDGWEIVSGEITPLPNTILMQFTGLLDKNGKEICEGDICKWPSGINREIVWDIRNACFSSRDVTLMAEIGKIAVLGHHLEIIGNIYQNPELLK